MKDTNIERTGNWIQTFSGLSFYPKDPRLDDICIRDIAHSLSMMCRFNGHCSRFYSVAEHSCHMYDLARTSEIKKWALMHDASEAYICDIPSPIKSYLTNYKQIESDVMRIICLKFGLDLEQPDEVHKLDHGMLSTEKEALMIDDKHWGSMEEPLHVKLQCWLPEQAEKEFLRRYVESFS